MRTLSKTCWIELQGWRCGYWILWSYILQSSVKHIHSTDFTMIMCKRWKNKHFSLFFLLGFIRARIWYKHRGVVQHNFSCASVCWDYINIHSLTVDLFQPAPCFHVGAWETFDIIRLSSTVFQCSVWNIETVFSVTSHQRHLWYLAPYLCRLWGPTLTLRWRRICTIWTWTLFLSLSFLNNCENITSVTLSQIFIKPQA